MSAALLANLERLGRSEHRAWYSRWHPVSIYQRSTYTLASPSLTETEAVVWGDCALCLSGCGCLSGLLFPRPLPPFLWLSLLPSPLSGVVTLEVSPRPSLAFVIPCHDDMFPLLAPPLSVQATGEAYGIPLSILSTSVVCDFTLHSISLTRTDWNSCYRKRQAPGIAGHSRRFCPEAGQVGMSVLGSSC